MSSPEVRASLVGGSEDVTVSLTPLQIKEGRTLAVFERVGAANRNTALRRIGVELEGSVCCRPCGPSWKSELEIKVVNKPGMVAHAFNPRTEEADPGGYVDIQPAWFA